MTSKQARLIAPAFVGITLGLLTRPDSASEPPDPDHLAHTKDAVRSRLVVLRSGGGGDTRAVVALGRPTSSNNIDDVKGTVQLLLHREVIRQAVLIAARDGLGLGTRDEVLGDRPPEAPGGGAAVVVSNFRMEPGASRVFVLRGIGDAKAETLLRHDLLPNSAAEFDYLLRLTTLAETLSRTALPEALKALGLKGEPNPYRAEAALPPNVEDRLEQLGFVETLAAVRDLHAAIRSDGESPARLGALARGYAQLGVLSEFQWHPAHKAFKARALLYAERLLARTEFSAGLLEPGVRQGDGRAPPVRPGRPRRGAEACRYGEGSCPRSGLGAVDRRLCRQRPRAAEGQGRPARPARRSASLDDRRVPGPHGPGPRRGPRCRRCRPRLLPRLRRDVPGAWRVQPPWCHHRRATSPGSAPSRQPAHNRRDTTGRP